MVPCGNKLNYNFWRWILKTQRTNQLNDKNTDHNEKNIFIFFSNFFMIIFLIISFWKMENFIWKMKSQENLRNWFNNYECHIVG